MAAALFGMLCPAAAVAQEVPYVLRTTYGDIGLLEMPSARMAPDGDLSATIGMVQSNQRFNFAFQLLPWLEGTFRYSRVPHISGTDVVYDRSFGMKIRFQQEDDDWPEIALGIRDLLGTGVYGTEYIVVSKNIGDFDVSTGLGWGRLASVDTFPNPFGLIFSSFKTRAASNATGGTVNFGQFFHGPSMGLFGGVRWHSLIPDLDVVAEYSSDAYKLEQAGGSFKVRMPVNLGLAYSFSDNLTASAGWFYGTSYGLTLSFSVNPSADLSPQHFGPQIPEPVIRQPEQQAAALTDLLAHNRPVVSAQAGSGPWVQVPTTPRSPDSLALASALMSMGEGVHDVDIAGSTVMVDAHLTRLADRQCDRYASIVSAVAPKLDTIAVSDLDDPSGKVAICNITHKVVVADAGDAGDGPPAPPLTDLPPDADPVAADHKIRDDVAAQSLRVLALSVQPTAIWIYYANTKYQSEAEAAGRIARVLMADAPAKVEIFHIVAATSAIRMREFLVTRSALERATLAYGTPGELEGAVSTSPAPLGNPVLDSVIDDSYPRFHWSISPGLREGFFDPDTPLQIQLLVTAAGSVEITPNLTLETRLEGNIYNNYDTSRSSNSQLPHVRSDLNLYFKHGINGISDLDAVYRARLAPEIYFEAKAGYLEDMFAGGGGQILWRPEGSRFALGVDAYEVWQRNYDRLFGFRAYHILTGHVTAYYQSPWYGLNFSVHAGRYLAGDYGATFEMSREFDTGVSIGAFATFTNVPFSKFGEGSFDKGIIIHIPLDWALPFYSQSAFDMNLRSLVRDGGQRLDDDDSLYSETLIDSYGEVQRHIDDIVAP